MVQSTSPWLTRIPDVARYPKLSSDLSTDVVVVGGGIAGTAAAYFLTQVGKRVALIEANHLGTGETGYTTAFLTSSVDTPFARLRERFGDAHARTVRALGEAAIARIEEVVTRERLACDLRRIDALAVGMTPDAKVHLAREADAVRAAGGAPSLLDADAVRTHTGIAASSALRIPAQGSFDVRAFLLGLADRIVVRGSRIFEETRMQAIDIGDRLTVRTASGTLTADHVVLATGLFPAPYREVNGFLRQMVTYVIALARAGAWRLPDALYWDVGEPFHYMRFLHPSTQLGVNPEPRQGSDGLFFVGGGDAPMKDATRAGTAPWEALTAFARRFVPDTGWTVSHQWRGQILETYDAFPLVGPAPGGLPAEASAKAGDPRVLLASGFGGNGMTFGTLAGVLAAEIITGARKPEDNPCRFDRATLSRKGP